MTGLSPVTIPDIYAAGREPAETPGLPADSRARLLALFQDKAFDITQVRHAAVDLQHSFCDAAEAARIIDGIAPRLKSLGIDTDWIYYASYGPGDGFERPVNPPGRCAGGTHKTEDALAPGDRLVPKFNPSAFDSTDYDETLTREKKKILLVSGYTYICCVKETIFDALEKGYQVVLMRDATDYAPGWSETFAERTLGEKLANAGAITVDSTDVFAALNAAMAARGPAP